METMMELSKVNHSRSPLGLDGTLLIIVHGAQVISCMEPGHHLLPDLSNGVAMGVLESTRVG